MKTTTAIGLREIAELSNVSLGTASDILNRNKRDRYNDDTIKRVVSVAKENGYRANHFAQAMRSRHSGIVGFAAANFTDDGGLDNYNIYPFLIGLNKRLADAGHHVGIVELAELDRPDPVMPLGLQELFYGALVIHYGLSPRAMDFARNLGMPIVWWDSGVFDPTGCLYLDETRASRELVERLLDLGHERIAYAVGQSGWQNYTSGKPVHFSYSQRYESYCETMKAHGLAPLPLMGYDPDGLTAQLEQSQATAIIVQSENVSFLHEPLFRLGWRMGKDLSLATLDCETRIRKRGLVVGGMRYDRFDAGRTVAEMVLAALADPEQPVPSIVLSPVFDAGQTIGRARRKNSKEKKGSKS